MRRLVFLGLILAPAAWFLAPETIDPAHVARAFEFTSPPDQGVPPGTLSSSASRAYVFVDKTGFGHQHGVEGRVKEGAIHLGAQQNAGKIVFDMTTFQADTDAARKYVGLTGTSDQETQQGVNANMLGPDVLNVKKFPTAEFVIDSALPLNEQSKAGNPKYRLEGKFTLHGATQKLTVDAEIIPRETGIWVRGAFFLKQTDYGMKPFSTALGAVGVADRLAIYGEMFVAK